MLSLGESDSVSTPPPLGDDSKAQKYIDRLSRLIHEDKLDVKHTDLKKFDPTSMQDHYRVDLGEYEVEVSHTKQAQSGKDFYVMLFNNLKNISQTDCQTVILAYIHLNEMQFKTFKDAAFAQMERRRKEAEQKRFMEALMPIDTILSNLNNQSSKKDTVRAKTEEVNLSQDSDSTLSIPPASS